MTLRRSSGLALSGALILALAAGCSPRTEPANTAEAPAPTPVAADTTQPAVDAAASDVAGARLEVQPAAMTALEKMSEYLRTLEAFEVKSDVTTEEVLENGQKVQFGGSVVYKVRKPDAFYVETATDRKQRSLYYDGKAFTLYAPRMKYYAQTEAPSTISEAVATMHDKYGLDFPLTDLFYWGTDQARADDIISAIAVGYAKVDGADCGQYAFRQGDVDWQIFIQQGDKPLPRKVVITTLTDDARPQFVAYLDWNEKPAFTGSTFTFAPPDGSHKIHIDETSSS